MGEVLLAVLLVLGVAVIATAVLVYLARPKAPPSPARRRDDPAPEAPAGWPFE